MISIIFVAGLMGVGLWLERIGPMSCFVDRLLTPWPMGALGLVLSLVFA